MKKSSYSEIIARPFVLAAIIAMPLTLNLGCDEDSDSAEAQAEQSPEAPESLGEPLQDGEERFGEGVTKFSEVNVSGTRLLFLNVADRDTGAESMALIEGGPLGAISLSIEPAFMEASLLDIFFATTGPEVAIPAELLGEPDHGLGERGWFVEKLVRGEYVIPRSVCTNSGFKTALRNWAPAIVGTETWVLDSTPNGGGQGWTGPHPPHLGGSCKTCTSSWYDYFYNDEDWYINTVDTIKLSIAACKIDSRPTLTSGDQALTHLGPSVGAWYRAQDNVTMNLIYLRDMAGPEYYRFAWIGNASVNDRDYRWRISDARDGDVFDMGYIWSHEGW